MNSVWQLHPEAVDFAIKRFLDGASTSTVANEICATFGVYVTRNAVIGVIHRMGIKRSKSVAIAPREKKAAAPKPKPELRRRWMPKPAAGSMPTKPALAPAPKPVVEARLPATGGVPFIEHQFGQCIFPLWGEEAGLDIRDKKVCGDSVVPTGGKEPACPYCARHAQLCFNGLPARRRRAAA